MCIAFLLENKRNLPLPRASIHILTQIFLDLMCVAYGKKVSVEKQSNQVLKHPSYVVLTICAARKKT